MALQSIGLQFTTAIMFLKIIQPQLSRKDMEVANFRIFFLALEMKKIASGNKNGIKI